LALLPAGFVVPLLLPASAVGSYPTLSPLPVRRKPPPSAVCSLWHFPSPRGARGLPGTVPCGARTFLEPHRAVVPTAGPRPPVPPRLLLPFCLPI